MKNCLIVIHDNTTLIVCTDVVNEVNKAIIYIDLIIQSVSWIVIMTMLPSHPSTLFYNLVNRSQRNSLDRPKVQPIGAQTLVMSLARY